MSGDVKQHLSEVVLVLSLDFHCKENFMQRYCVKFCQKLGDSQMETIWKIQTSFGDDAMGIIQMKEWYNWFKDGCTSVDNEPHSGGPSTRRNDQVIVKVNTVVRQDHCVAI